MKYIQRNLKWTIILLAFCIVLTLLGSINIGHAAPGGKSQANIPSSNSGSGGSTPSQPGKSSVPTATPRVLPSPTASPTPITSTQTSGGTSSTPTQSPTGSPASPTPTQVPQFPTQIPNGPQVPTPSTSNVMVQDTFMRQDQVTWGSTTDGHIWQASAASSNIFSISNQQGRVAQANGFFDAIIGPRLSNESVKATGIINFAQSDGTTSIGLVLRWQDSNNWYKAYIDGTTLGIRKSVNGQRGAPLIMTKFFVQPGVPYTLRFHAAGPLLQAKAWPSNTPEPQQWTLTTYDTDPALTSGFGGLRIGVQDETAVYITSFIEKRI